MVYLFDKLRDMDWDECLKTLHFYLTCFEYIPETVITSIELEKKIEKEQRRFVIKYLFVQYFIVFAIHTIF